MPLGEALQRLAGETFLHDLEVELGVTTSAWPGLLACRRGTSMVANARTSLNSPLNLTALKETLSMPGKSMSAFAENLIVWAILIGTFAAVGAILLWAAGHLSLWRPMLGGMLLILLVGVVFYAVLIPIEPMLKLRADEPTLGYILINGAASWGLSVWSGWTLGQWAGATNASDPDLLDAILVYASAAVCFWLSNSSVGLLFNGTIYVWGSMIAGFVALVMAAIMS